MKLVTFETGGGGARVGAILPERGMIVDLAASVAADGGDAAAFGTMIDLIEAGEPALAQARDVVEGVETGRGAAPIATDAARLLAPIPRPTQMRDTICFEKHLRQARDQRLRLLARAEPDPDAAYRAWIDQGLASPPDVWFEQPLGYVTNRMSVVGPEADIVWPAYSDYIDFELEFAAVIGRKTRNASLDTAGASIFGYMIFNDFSARDAQAKEMKGNLGPMKGKSFDTGNALGPWLVTADEIADPYDLRMRAWINGEMFCDASSGTMHHRFERIIEHMSADETLYPGEVLGSGTVGGGCALEYGKRLARGDVVELDVAGLGRLRNRIV